MLLFIAGLMVGGIVGVLTMCLMFAAKEADAHLEECEYEVIDETAQNADSRGEEPK